MPCSWHLTPPSSTIVVSSYIVYSFHPSAYPTSSSPITSSVCCPALSQPTTKSPCLPSSVLMTPKYLSCCVRHYFCCSCPVIGFIIRTPWFLLRTAQSPSYLLTGHCANIPGIVCPQDGLFHGGYHIPRRLYPFDIYGNVAHDGYDTRLQNINGGHSSPLAFYFCPFWGACLQVTRLCRQDYFVVNI